MYLPEHFARKTNTADVLFELSSNESLSRGKIGVLVKNFAVLQVQGKTFTLLLSTDYR